MRSRGAAQPGRVPTLAAARAAVLVAALGMLLLAPRALPQGSDSGPDSTAADSLADRAERADRAGRADTTGGMGRGEAALRESGLAPVPWKIGEYFQFSIDWNGLNGGSSLMQVQNFQRVDGRRCYRIVTKAESNSFVSKFYKVRDRAESSMDAESLYSRRFVKRLREGGYKKDVDVRFDHQAGKAIYADGKVLDVTHGVHDVLSAFYYVRTRPLPDGATLVIPTHDNDKSYQMEVQVLKRERVEVPAGTFSCVVVEPKLKSEGIFKSKGSMQVWLTDDERRMPVLVRSSVPVGSISVRLTDYRLAFEGRR